ncbi:S8 family serine peptidase [Tessaracoccus lubricantis]|uniref:S8 family serine peptidase n=2 Tax=Tessaracoccus lubricantis TaxID=545543 RepID=UPI0031E6D1D0
MKRYLWRAAASAVAAGVLLSNAAVVASAEEPDVFRASRCDFNQPTQEGQLLDAWHLQRLRMEEVWPLATGKGVTVAVIDTGVSTDGSLYYAPDRVRAFDFVGVSDDERDKKVKVDCLHGTFVTSLLAAGLRPDGGSVNPLTNFAGIAPDVDVLAYRALAHSALPPEEGGQAPPPESLEPAVNAVNAAIDAGADIINLSLTVQRNVPFFDEFEAAINRAVSAGIIVVAAAGNGDQNVGPLFPASFPGVVAVGMSTEQESAHRMSYAWSEAEIGAPGAGIVGLAPSQPDLNATTANQAFHLDTGTSFAAPIVSGVIALMLDYDQAMGRERATAEEIVTRLQATADPPPASAPDRQLGWGIVNPLRALMDTRPAPMSTEAAGFTAPPPPTPEAEPVDARMPVLGLGVAVGAVLAVGLGVVAAIAIPAATRRAR